MGESKGKDGVDLSLVLACYNEGPTFTASVHEIVRVLDDTRLSFEVILIDDASSDGTAARLGELAAVDPRFRVSFHRLNLGRGGTVSEGLRAAFGRVAGFVDIDLETAAHYIPAMVRAIDDGADVAVAWRIYKIKPGILVRWILSRGYVALVRTLLKVPFRDTEGGYKFFRRERLLPVLAEVRDQHWFWDTEVMARAHYRGLRIVEVPTLFMRRRDKKSTVRLWRDVKRYFASLLAFLPEARRLRAEAASHVSPHADPRRVGSFYDGFWRHDNRAVQEVHNYWPACEPSERQVREALGSLAEARLLELGPGRGDDAVAAARDGARVLVVDVAVEALLRVREQARQAGLAHRIDVALMDAHRLGLRDEVFDRVFARGVLMHVVADDVAREARRVLRPDGRAVSVDMLRGNPFVRLYRLVSRTFDAVKPRYLTPADLARLAGYFAGTDRHEYYVLSVFAIALGRRDGAAGSLLRWVQRCDETLLTRIPALRRWAWIGVTRFDR